METLGTRIKTIRKKNSLTQQSFADRISVSRPFISRIEANKETPSDALIKLIALEFNVSYDWLINGKGEMSIEANEGYDYFERKTAPEYREKNIKILQELLDYCFLSKPSAQEYLLNGILISLQFLLQQFKDDEKIEFFVLEAGCNSFMSFTDAMRFIKNFDKNSPAYLNQVYTSLRMSSNEIGKILQALAEVFEQQSK